MEASLPDPITNYNRQIGQSRYRQREEYIIAHHPGFNLDYWRRIIRASGRVERLGRQWGWTPNQIMLTKALLISRMACIFIDHIIRRMEQAGILDHRAEAPDLEWKNQYHHFQLLFLRQHEIPDRFEIVMLIQRLHRYTVAPLFLLSFRQRHWKRLRKIIAPILRPETATLLLQRQPLADYSDPVAAARHICFTAALYADIQESLGRQHWSYAYSDFMLRRYEYIHRFSQVLAILIGMHETPSNPPLSHIL